jgi:hypothetical protein
MIISNPFNHFCITSSSILLLTTESIYVYHHFFTVAFLQEEEEEEERKKKNRPHRHYLSNALMNNRICNRSKQIVPGEKNAA